jgi:glutamine cyclotransferase
MNNTINFRGETYQVKSHNGYVFATETLGDLLAELNFEGDAEELDNQIAYYFDDDTFNEKTAEELYAEFDAHS